MCNVAWVAMHEFCPKDIGCINMCRILVICCLGIIVSCISIAFG